MCLGLVGWFVSWNENMKRSTTDGDGPLATVDKKRQIVVQDNLHLAQVDPIDISLLGRETRVISSDSNVQYPSFYFETGTSWVDLSGGTLSFKFKLVKAKGATSPMLSTWPRPTTWACPSSVWSSSRSTTGVSISSKTML